MRIDGEVLKVIGKINKNGFIAYVVGGAVRDHFLGLEPTDFDIVTNADMETIKRIFPNTVESGKGHNTVSVVSKSGLIDVSKFRGKIFKNHENSLLDDLENRDFTINAIAYEPFEKRFIDPFEAISELQSPVVTIQACKDPQARFMQDPLRILRITSMALKIETASKKFKIDNATLEKASELSYLLKNVAFERITNEFTKILVADNVEVYLSILNRIGALHQIMPKCAISPEDIAKVKRAKKDMGTRLAILLYLQDINSVIETLNDLKLSKNITKKIIKLLNSKDIKIQKSDLEIRKLISTIGKDTIYDFLEVKSNFENFNLESIKQRVDYFIKNDFPLEIKDLKINGMEIMGLLGLKQGKIIGKILNFLLTNVIQDPSLNNKKSLLKLADSFKKSTH